MKLIIPMSGHGSRFKKVGYIAPKPLIIVEGRPIISHVLDMFPGIAEEDIVFICSTEHLETTNMAGVLESIAPKATIRSVDMSGAPKGPIYPLQQHYDTIPDSEPVMVSYCDFTQQWDFHDFATSVAEAGVAGAVPSYTGFHPHLLRKQLYGGVLTDANGYMVNYREKYCFTENPEDSHHSSGMYYFQSGRLLKQYCDEVVSSDLQVGGEYYVSLPYYYMLRDALRISVPTANYFMQWGTPEDLEEYEAWSRRIHNDLGLEKKITDIPRSREQYVTIPWNESSEEFKKSYVYWRTYFAKKLTG